MKKTLICGIGNSLVDSEYKVSDKELISLSLTKGCMELNNADNHIMLADTMKKTHGIVKKMPGGSVANSLYTLSQFGLDVSFTGRVSNDDVGTSFMKSLKDVGMEIFINQVNHGITGECLVLITPDHERTMYTHLGVSSELCKDDINKDAIINSKYLLIEGYLVTSEDTKEAALSSLDIAKENNVKKIITLSDPNIVNFFKDDMMQIVKKNFDIIFCNKQESLNISSSDNINSAMEFLKKFSNEVVITSGSEGAYVSYKNELFHMPSIKAKPIDLTGAGDMFLAAYMSARVANKSISEGISFANKCSGRIIEKYGAKFDTDSEYRNLYSTL
tara:strand:+ start:1688 stop:2680 length:993 start_codon:yes stop_codon:yes gene_type:complete